MSNKKYKTAMLLMGIIALLSISSCVSIALRSIGVFSYEARLVNLSHHEKEVLMIPMHHIGTHEFYADVAHKIDSLQRLGYVGYVESVSIRDLDSIDADQYYRKSRKLMGVNTTKYYDTLTRKVMGKFTYRGRHNLRMQPSYAKLKVDTANMVFADTQMHLIIRDWEQKHGKIELEDCDWETALTDDYECKHLGSQNRSIFMRDYVQSMRNDYVVHLIDSLPHDKILLVYGSAHLSGFEKLLQEKK
ncbi:MAG: hypothetical protein Q4F57_07035 [Weeksellaceae bacterium]|nr:hypothetical protein [Weeksellaceae bacterium]